MIHLHATRIDQSYSLEDGRMQNFLIFELPDGTELKALIDDEQATKIVNVSVNGTDLIKAPLDNGAAPVVSMGGLQPPPTQTVGASSDEQDAANAQALFDNLQEPASQPAAEGKLINWAVLPNGVLTPTMKAAFKTLGAAPQMTFSEVQQLATNVADRFGPDDWAKITKASAVTAAPALPRPPVGKVQWADGSPLVAGGAPARTVPTTDAGYPIVDNNEVDPGELVVAGDVDEDGVGQL